MLTLFSSIKSFLKLNKVCIDNHIFQLHYKVTVGLLMACSIMVTAKQFFGDPISCIVDDIPQKVIDTYCWIQSTFTIPVMWDQPVGEVVPHDGIGNFYNNNPKLPVKKYHKYYQWVVFMLFFQGELIFGIFRIFRGELV